MCLALGYIFREETTSKLQNFLVEHEITDFSDNEIKMRWDDDELKQGEMIIIVLSSSVLINS